ncbi:MAG TPA: adenylate/guanylate cyclase domain-containing protein [Puia sp.]|nr:adenylate/guanylate cyclase domain-containing protein [Puia sp.]
MPRINLKTLLSPKSDAYALASSLIRELDALAFVEDLQHQVLLGTRTSDISFEEAIRNEEDIVGWVKGNERASLIASLINGWIQKELEKKRLANEVLLLYQEVNLMFNFSEKLAQTIGQAHIAAITLDEARRLIKSDQGLIVLWDEDSGKMDLPASFGQPVFDEARWQSEPGQFLSLFQSGQSEIMGDLTVLKDAGLVLPEIQSILYAALKVKHRVMGAIVLASIESVQYTAADLKFLITLALQSASAIESAILYEKNIREAKEREEAMRRIYEVTNKFVPHEFIGSLGKTVITDIQLGDKVEKIVTVLFSDIRDYTSLSEGMTPEENFSFVCSFNERMGPIIRQHHGFINQYLGDAIMAIFPGNASDALAAAIGMQKAVKELNASRASAGRTPIKIGVGMHTGPLIMGITGDHERLDAATISDTVNTASRLEGLTKHYGVSIVLSEASVNNLAHTASFYFCQLGLIQLKGKLAPIRIYECFNGLEEHDFGKKLTALPLYKQGVFDYFNKSFKDASDKFCRVLEINPEDRTSKLFLGRANHYLDAGIPENWTGVEEMQHK